MISFVVIFNKDFADFVFDYCILWSFKAWTELPHWTDIVKTAKFKELAPYDADWYYIRAGLGVSGFKKIYGGRKRNESRPPHFCKSNGSIDPRNCQVQGRCDSSKGYSELFQKAYLVRI
ncbi:hypothetical protein MKW94_010370 [Papaver nudicaule]|uniref:Ribosomal protein S19 n=1 Tax=Papaver nudicaule TaxID=74823 RepID=A0AA42B1Y9_PAPNU|nr:hypothetical protein [Papaver nudicaule]